VITNWADLEEIVPAHRAHNVLLKKLNLADKFVVQYAGNIGRMHGLEVLLEAAKILKERTDIHFLLVGSGAKKQWLESLAKKEGLNDVSFLSPQPRSDLADVLNASDVAIISFIPGMAGVSVPSKMYNILAAGKPIIALVDHDSETAMVVREEQIGWVVPPERPDLVAAALEEASADRQCLLEMGKRARAAAEGKYSFQRVIESYRELLENV
jgi:glycosyltransferase involved in cell wall biosynthesis